MILRNAIVIAAFAAGIAPAVAAPGECFLEVDGRSFIDGACKITMERNGSFKIMDNLKPFHYFAIVSIDTDEGTATADWNEEAGANHAHTPLGPVVRQGGCWTNATARVCAWKPGTRPKNFR